MLARLGIRHVAWLVVATALTCALLLTSGAGAAGPATTSAGHASDAASSPTTSSTSAPSGALRYDDPRQLSRGRTRAAAGRLAAKGERTLYRAVSDAELDDIAKNGLRVDPSGRGYQTEKLFTGTAQDAARQAQIAHKLSGQASTIIEARFPSSVDILAGRADSMDIFSVGAGNLSRGRVSRVLNSSPIPRR